MDITYQLGYGVTGRVKAEVREMTCRQSLRAIAVGLSPTARIASGALRPMAPAPHILVRQAEGAQLMPNPYS